MTTDYVNHPPHYTKSDAHCENCDFPIECIDVVRHMPFNLGNAMKYIWRVDLKGNDIQDLQKAIWYLQDEILRRKKDKGHEVDTEDYEGRN